MTIMATCIIKFKNVDLLVLPVNTGTTAQLSFDYHADANPGCLFITLTHIYLITHVTSRLKILTT